MSSNPYLPPASDTNIEKSRLIRSELLRAIFAGFVSAGLIIAGFLSPFVSQLLEWSNSTLGAIAGVAWLYLQVCWAVYPSVRNFSDARKKFLHALIGVPALIVASTVAFGYAMILVTLMIAEL